MFLVRATGTMWRLKITSPGNRLVQFASICGLTLASWNLLLFVSEDL